MCGIAGYISLQHLTKPAGLKEATALLQHRGPDAEGFYFSVDETVGLGQRRLSILDLSTSADQPMFSADGRYCIVFNGEIYNFNELKLQLKDKGAYLKTTSDTEVIVELFAQKGVGCLKDLNGMFALAVFDLRENIVTLARDHAGIKPLFIYYDDSDFIFASELKAIRSMKRAQLVINKAAIPYFLHLGFIPHPHTIYLNTFKFPAAHYLQITLHQQSFDPLPAAMQPFWRLESKIQPQTLMDEAAAKRNLSALLFNAVEKQLISDVPLGTFLSGGIDSSLVTSIACRVSHQKINSFSIAIDDGRFNESKYALQVAEHLQTHHHEFRVTEKEVLELIDAFLPLYDEPFADSSAFPTMMVSRLAKKYVTVALSGDGGDELFMGYGMHQWAKRLSAPWVTPARHALVAASSLMNNKYKRAGNLFDFRNKGHIKSHIFSQEQYFFKEKELNQILLDEKFDFGDVNRRETTARKLEAAEQQSLWDFNYYLPDDLLVKVDRASMHYSLETRVPLLDYRIIDFAFNLDRKLKMKNTTMKYLLKEVLYDYVPREFFERPKQGFSIPLNKWLKTDLHYLLEKYTSREVIERQSVVRFAVVEQLKKQYRDGRDYLFSRLWVIIVLHWWLEENPIPE